MKRILSFILSINLIFILVPGTVLAAPSWPSAVSIEADGGILMEAQTGTVLLLKMRTSLIILPALRRSSLPLLY